MAAVTGTDIPLIEMVGWWHHSGRPTTFGTLGADLMVETMMMIMMVDGDDEWITGIGDGTLMRYS